MEDDLTEDNLNVNFKRRYTTIDYTVKNTEFANHYKQKCSTEVFTAIQWFSVVMTAASVAIVVVAIKISVIYLSEVSHHTIQFFI